MLSGANLRTTFVGVLGCESGVGIYEGFGCKSEDDICAPGRGSRRELNPGKHAPGADALSVRP